MDDDDDACASKFLNTTLDFGLFSYAPSVVNLTLYFDCPNNLSSNFSSHPLPLKLKCGINSTGSSTPTTTDAYFVISNTSRGSSPMVSSYGRSVEVPIMGSAISGLTDNPSSLLRVLKEGFDVSYEASTSRNDMEFCLSCSASGGTCGYYEDSTVKSLTCFCRNGGNGNTCGGGSSSVEGKAPKLRRKLIIGGATLGVLLVSVLLIILICCFRRKFSLGSRSSFKWLCRKEQNKHQTRLIDAFFENYGSLAPKRFKYAEVKKMTSYFKEKLGQGGYGSVFKGQLHDGRLVAVKVLSDISKSSKSNGEEFLNEVASISKTSHVNVVKLIGFCYNGNKRALIYEFMPNGSLDKFIYQNKQLADPSFTLGWESLFQFAIGISRGLEYLHRGCTTRILHFDIKPQNILLDKNFRPKIADFGLAKLCSGMDSIISMLGTRGTAGYIAPEVFSRNFGGISHKSDVYSYGMMVLEMVGGRKNIDVQVELDHSSQLYFPHWIYDRLKLEKDLGLQGLMMEETEKLAKKLTIVGLWCIQTNPLSRPSMSKVLEMLEGSVESLKLPPKPFLSSPPPRSTSSSYHPSNTREEQSSSISGGENTLHGIEAIPILYNAKAGNDSLSTMEVFRIRSDAKSGNASLPAIEGLQIHGDAKPGNRLRACGFPKCGTALCMFQWTRHLDPNENRPSYIEDPDYVVTADDVDKLIAVDCIPMNGDGCQGELMRLFANNQTKITCDLEMQMKIKTHISEGQARFNVLRILWKDTSKVWEPRTFILNSQSFQIRNVDDLIFQEDYSDNSYIQIPYGHTAQLVLTCSDGSSHLFSTGNDVRMRDILVLTMRTFQSKALYDKKKEKA
ncbi:LEAF RUST 10 DISEASE-RESISTANCE LOCUS RECEPTOR-LIKE PROTEIN KINASE-like 2.1 isoform X2 [Papaver somniferum]|uniref:LEAF RUST 10 DISEASE-RESISTANCE LOCUS RECEPTOR-LIKE PROTEIN KINASE-like 2.1 isoform X2 n=1 Tax=Papaver somniferum TaxID=3469 RepID=UPI000E6FE11F|nr:LEAF RUST 10 DISEASE-RESISTANCE LOCUS RECEPTOR-LIKE PROTEIN KINASE-like 2.1 isoform X2 [Papaver somniferum]